MSMLIADGVNLFIFKNIDASNFQILNKNQAIS